MAASHSPATTVLTGYMVKPIFGFPSVSNYLIKFTHVFLVDFLLSFEHLTHSCIKVFLALENNPED